MGSVAITAGCLGGQGTTRTLTDFLQIESHSFSRSSTMLVLEVLLRNVSDTELSFTQISCDLYNGDRRIGDSFNNVSAPDPGKTAAFEVSFLDISEGQRSDISEYEITVETEAELESYSRTWTFEGPISLN
jgi:hypothetical protein